MKTAYTTILLILLTTGVSIHTSGAQPQSAHFDLLIYGSGLENVSVAIMENPGTDDSWVEVSEESSYEIKYNQHDEARLMVLRNLPVKQFVGQDIRENYIAMRMEASKSERSSQVAFRGAWALHSNDNLEDEELVEWLGEIQNDPVKIKKRSFASVVYPRKRDVPETQPLIEHIELPVRHLKAGVQEVRWLEILFQP